MIFGRSYTSNEHTNFKAFSILGNSELVLYFSKMNIFIHIITDSYGGNWAKFVKK